MPNILCRSTQEHAPKINKMITMTELCQWNWARPRCIVVEAERVVGQLVGKGEVDRNNSTTNSANHGKTTSKAVKGKAEVSLIRVSAIKIIIIILIKIHKIMPVGTVAK